MKIATFAGAAIVAAMASSGVQAQVCAGRPSFDNTPTRLAVGVGRSPATQRIAVSAFHGTERLFGGASIGFEDGPDARALLAGVAVGADQPLTLDNRLHLCAEAALDHRWMALPQSIEARTARITGRFGLGLLAANSPAFNVIPTAGIAFHHDRPLAGRAHALAAESFATADAGVGVIVPRGFGVHGGAVVRIGRMRSWAITAAMTVPLSRR